ncbi:hypothetical protein QQF64_006808 [Cirrhinus molitorella]|uniref:Uncharacterized protein n=1 Tax=Cirrhinus molitorella TaxID=172907 RepID=A0ABR3MCY4_9TELE
MSMIKLICSLDLKRFSASQAERESESERERRVEGVRGGWVSVGLADRLRFCRGAEKCSFWIGPHETKTQNASKALNFWKPRKALWLMLCWSRFTRGDVIGSCFGCCCVGAPELSPGNQVQGAASVRRFPSAFTFPLHLTWTAPPSLRRSSHDRARSAVPGVQLAAAASSSLHPRPGALPPAARHFARSGSAVTRTLNARSFNPYLWKDIYSRLRRTQLRPASCPLPTAHRNHPCRRRRCAHTSLTPCRPFDGEKMQSTGASGNIRGPCIQTD